MAETERETQGGQLQLRVLQGGSCPFSWAAVLKQDARQGPSKDYLACCEPAASRAPPFAHTTPSTLPSDAPLYRGAVEALSGYMQC